MPRLSDDHLSTVFTALAHPARRRILGILTDGSATTKDLAPELGLSVATVRRHVAVLESAALVVRERHGHQRPVRLTAWPLEDATAYLNGYHPFWQSLHARADRLRGETGSEMPQPAVPVPRHRQHHGRVLVGAGHASG